MVIYEKKFSLQKCPGSIPAEVVSYMQVSIGLRKSPSGYARTQRVTQPMILLCLFQVIVQQNMIRI